MAKNLRASLAETDTLTVFDLNKQTMANFVKDVAPAKVQLAVSARDLAEKSVCGRFVFSINPYYSIADSRLL